MKITIDLQEGFDKDEVIIFEKQNKIFHAKDISTRTQIGLAKSIEVELSGKEPIKIVVPSRGVSEKKKIDVTEGGYIAVSITDENKLDWKSSNVPTMYM